MTPQGAIEIIKIAIAEVEWKYPMEYAIAFEDAIKSLEKQIQKPKTNYDRIRNMSVEELADFILDYDTIGGCPLPEINCMARTCIECIKKWLESEVQGE